jgi:prepilin-type N-terminal cleavage/methylation domain-containing protein
MIHKQLLPSSRGFSLLELLFALAVAALIIVSAVNRYQQSQWEQNLAVTQRSIQTLLQAMNHYFYAYCHSEKQKREQAYNIVSVGRLLPNTELPTNPFGSAFEVSIKLRTNPQLNQPLYELKLTAKYPSVAIANNLRQQLGADTTKQELSELTWTRLPTVSSIADSSSSYWIQEEAFNRDALDGLRTYVEQSRGLPSDPWTPQYIDVCDNRST